MTEEYHTDCLRDMWMDLQSGASEVEMARVRGAIEFAHRIGLLSDEQEELWKRRIGTCPDTDHVGGRIWCAYCGTVNHEQAEE